MAKNYKFFFSFFIEAIDGPSVTNDFFYFDHANLTPEDIEEAELTIMNRDPVMIKNAETIYYDLKEVTGTFTYRVTYEVRNRSLHPPINLSLLCTLGHKLTATTHDDDIMSFTDQIRTHLDDSSRQYSQILFIQEIPDN